MIGSKVFFDFLKLILDFHLFCPKAFREAIKLAVKYKENSTDFMDEVLRELEVLEDNLQFNTVLLGESTCTCTVSTMFVMAVKIDREKRLVM